MKIGILKETKNPPDRRVPLSPEQVLELQRRIPGTEVRVQRSSIRCFADEEYARRGIPLSESLEECEILLGVKEVDPSAFLPGRTYLFFSHTGKKQAHNREMLREMVRKGITLIDYEYLTDRKGQRLVAFGRWAGIVGAYNGIRAWGLRYKSFDLRPAHACTDLRALHRELEKIVLPPIKCLVTGGGRVAGGAMEILSFLNMLEVPVGEYLSREIDRSVVCRIDPDDYVRRKDGQEFTLKHFFAHPGEYLSTFYRYVPVTDMYIACHYWDPSSPVFLSRDDYLRPDFRIRVIADISCDVQGPLASTLRASSIHSPFYGYVPETGQEGDPFEEENLTVMAVDNLPGELPRDASMDFGENLIRHIFPVLAEKDSGGLLREATILKEGKLTEAFSYLTAYLKGEE